MYTYYEIALYFSTASLGLLVGALICLVANRLPAKAGLSGAKSATLAHRRLKYSAVALLNAVLWIGCAVLFWKDSVPYACSSAMVCSVGLCIAVIDIGHMIIFDRFQIALLILGTIITIFDQSTEWYSHLIGMTAGAIVFFSVAQFGKRVWRRESLGEGDIKLAAVIGLILGWEKLILCILIASITASVILIILRRLRGDEKGSEYPFAPFLVFGTVVSLLFGDMIIAWYINALMGYGI